MLKCWKYSGNNTNNNSSSGPSSGNFNFNNCGCNGKCNHYNSPNSFVNNNYKGTVPSTSSSAESFKSSSAMSFKSSSKSSDGNNARTSFKSSRVVSFNSNVSTSADVGWGSRNTSSSISKSCLKTTKYCFGNGNGSGSGSGSNTIFGSSNVFGSNVFGSSSNGSNFKRNECGTTASSKFGPPGKFMNLTKNDITWPIIKPGSSFSSNTSIHNCPIVSSKNQLARSSFSRSSITRPKYPPPPPPQKK